MMKVVFASNNAGKVRELSDLLKDLHIELIPQAELGIPEIAETGLTFIENALIKARHASRITHLPAIADDSGLAVAALGGKPGIYSSRYAGANASDADNIKRLLADLASVPEQQRSACFHCVLVFMSHAEDPTPLVCHGKWPGFILTSPSGQHGFGYDPVFYVPTHHKTAAELPLAIKNQISHRALALKALLTLLPEKQ